MTRAQREHQPICPKCGYDQSGIISTWEDRCPLQSTCSECGEVFKWTQVYRTLSEWGSEIAWYAEHAHGPFSMIRRTPGTLVRFIIPSMFFRRVHHRWRVRPVVLFAWMLLLFAPLWLVTSVFGGMAQMSEGVWSLYELKLPADSYHWMLALRDILNAASFPYAQWYGHNDGLALVLGSDALGNAYAMTFGLIPFLVVTLCWLAIVMLVPSSRELALERPKLLLRGVILGIMPVVFLIPLTRALIGWYVYRGWSVRDDWVQYAQVIAWCAALLWQQCIWTAHIRWGLNVRPSWYINLPGFFASLLLGFYVMARVVW